MTLREYERTVDNKEMPTSIVIHHPVIGGFADTTTIKWDGSKWIREEYFVCEENLAPPSDFTRSYEMEQVHCEILLSEYGLNLKDVDEKELPNLSPSSLAKIAQKR